MRRWSLALLFSLASPVFAQEAQEAPAAAPPPAAEPTPAPAPAAEQASPATESAPAAESAPAEKPRRRRRQEASAEAPAAETPVAAQAPAPQAPTPAPTPAPTAAAPTPVAPPAPAPEPGSVQEEVRDEARYLLGYLLTGDVRSSVPLISFPFQLEERRFDAPEPLVVTWVKALRNKRTDLVTLYDIEVLSYAELEKKYGKPPARLGAIVPRGTEVYGAVANLSGRAAVILYRKDGDSWKAFAYTD
ncbi:hypothetical protein [Archangium lansingense]|uniref:Uncharacterized protein n=1 Tax=Archangium lansingense TaxID=2995310 RepID=A0ABT4A9C2_9BACT|nr:hypothetical protein [Archangium lansinium]MCY1077854.1 hypothetical protein [Archangium lansinium]